LKMAHAQRLLPLEQLLSGVELPLVADRKLPAMPEPKKASDNSAVPKPFVSPFAADSARKGTPRMESANDAPIATPRPSPAAISSPSVVMGSAAPAAAFECTAEAITKVASANVEDVRVAVLNALASAGLSMLSSMLEAGDWKIEGSELSIRIAASPALIEMSVSNEGRKIVIASASGSIGRPMKLQILSGGLAQPVAARLAPPPPNGSSRGRAEQEPVIQRLREKFGAEIRTVIDYKQKR
jgi:hypothetical protein